LPHRFSHRAPRRPPLPDTSASAASWIPRLASTDAREREQAARELFRQGCATAEPILRRWFDDREFRKLIPTGNVLLTLGVAVEPAQFETIWQNAGRPHRADVPPDQDALEFSLSFAHGVRLDILTTREPGGHGAIARFLQRFGAGIQQVECDVRDVTRATELLRTRFATEPIYPETREGADGTRVNFFLVSADENRKVLIELVEVPAKPQSRIEGKKK
jgi:hypothetical protein